MKKRTYPALERAVGSRTPAKTPTQGMVRRGATKKAPLARKTTQKFQLMLEKTVQTLLLTATPSGDLTFRADIKAAVLNDLSVDIRLFGKKQLVIIFYCSHKGVRSLIQGYERQLVQHLQSRGLQVKEVRFQNAPDPDEPPPVPIV